MIRKIVLALLLAAAVVTAVVYAAGRGWLGRHEGPGSVTASPRPAEVVAARVRAQRVAAGARGIAAPKQILFGDLHVHTTVSFDAFLLSLPLLQGEGAHPQGDACDFARFCSGLDFWSINDHAEGFTPQQWRDTVDSVRQCNAVAGDPENPDVVAFLGWEWTQVGMDPASHYGHKNVVLAHTEDGRIPDRPISAAGMVAAVAAAAQPGPLPLGAAAVLGLDRRYFDFARYLADRAASPLCPTDVPLAEIPADCRLQAGTPAELFSMLDEWGYEALVIPHGTTWGFYTPPGSSWDKQLAPGQHDPNRQTLIEVYSGHGNSEEYRDWRAAVQESNGDWTCPEPSPGYLSPCWRAGEIIRERCSGEGLPAAECEARAAEARRNAVQAGVAGHLTVPGARAEDWLDAGQCRDCVLPAFNYRPGGSAQYIMAIRNFQNPLRPARFRFGFIASSDNHTARPGTGYKERDRREMTEATGAARSGTIGFLQAPQSDSVARSRPFDRATTPARGFELVEAERQASFFLTGGLVAAHSEGRSREAIWRSLGRREVYGTSGPRILLWFDLENAPASGGAALPMGSQTIMAESPRFRVRAVGSFEQQPGCPEYSVSSLSAERLEHLCRGECYNPSDRRRLISRIEVVRVRPQNLPGEPIANLIDDPWQSFACAPDPAGCSAVFEDPEFPEAARDAIYYARAIEAPSLAVNAANLRCRERDAAGQCLDVDPCYGDYRTPYQEDCLAPTEERAWSSPIFVDFREPGNVGSSPRGNGRSTSSPIR